jgi:hypothetical protein
VNYVAIASALKKLLTPAQACWVCIISTGAVYTYSVQTFASNTEVKAIHVTITEGSLFDLRSKQCEAIRRNQSGAAYRSKIQELMRTYRELTGADYPLPNCEEL